MLKMGVIGCGNRITHVINMIMSISKGEAVVTCVCDTDIEKVKRENLKDEKFNEVRYYTDGDQMLKNEELNKKKEK